MTPLLLTLAVVVAGLLGVALWWIRRTNLAVQPAGRAPLHSRPLPAGCGLGALLSVAHRVDQPA